MQFLLIISLILSFFIVAPSKGAPKNIFTPNLGLNIQPAEGLPDNCDINSQQEFLPYKNIFMQNGKLLVFSIPKNNSNWQYCYTGLGPFAIKKLMLYRLSFRLNKLNGKNSAFLYLSFFKGEKFISCQRMFIIAANSAPAAMTGYFRDFATPPDADKMILWIALSSGSKNSKTGPKLLLTDVKITPLKQLLAVNNEINPASLQNLNNKLINAGSGSEKLSVTIENSGQDKSMRIIKERKDQYPWFNIRMPDENYDGKLVQLSLSVRQ